MAELTNGLLIILGRLPSFIATLAMLSAARGLSPVISGNAPLNPIPEAVRTLGSGTFLGFVPLPIILMLVMWAAVVILRSTYAGRCMYAIGGNEEASRLILGVLRNGLNLLNVSSDWQQVVIGVVFAWR